jgi:hypothetical protein
MEIPRRSKSAGVALLGAAILFWVGWLLMPGVGLTDAAVILDAVGAQRASVYASVSAHLGSAVLLAGALPGIAALQTSRPPRWFWVAAGLLGAGVGAIAADAIFHFVAFEMTAPGIDRGAVLPVMVGLQTTGLKLLLPLVLAFFAGAGALAGAASRAGLVSRWNPRLHGIAFAFAIVGGVWLGPRGGGRVVGLLFLALISASMAWVGVAMMRTRAT